MPKSYDQYISEIDAQLLNIITAVQGYYSAMPPKQIHDTIWKAYEFAKQAHKSDTRHSGEPYISHPVAATEILLSLKPDISTIEACLMHDVIEDTPYTYEEILEIF